MSWAGSSRLTVYLGARVAALAPAVDGPAIWFPGESPEDVFEQSLRYAISDRWHKRRKVVDVRLSGALARPFIFEAVLQLKSWQDANEVAAAMAPDATGLAGPCSVWLDNWRPDKRCVAVAIDTSLQDSVQDIARCHKARISALRPWWKTAIDATCSWKEDAPQILAVMDSDSLTVITGDSLEYLAMTTYAPKPELWQARAVLTRSAMTANLQTRDIAWAVLGDLDPRGIDSTPDENLSLKPTLTTWK